MTNDLERRAGKGPDDEHPEMAGDAESPDPSDYADPRVVQPGDDPPGEDARTPQDPDPNHPS